MAWWRSRIRNHQRVLGHRGKECAAEKVFLIGQFMGLFNILYEKLLETNPESKIDIVNSNLLKVYVPPN